jgi:bacterioferritin (cytochrome b1)
VVTEPAEADPASRRGLLTAAGAGFVGGAALLVSACGGGSHSSSPQTTTTTSGPVPNSADAELLNHLLDLEHLGIAAYTAGIPLLSPAGRKDGQLFLTQEISHAGELAGLVHQAGGKPHKGRETYNLGHPQTGADVLRLLHRIERSQIDAYLDAIPRVSLGSTRAALAAMLANDAQHISVLRLSLGRRPIPTALVTGHE